MKTKQLKLFISTILFSVFFVECTSTVPETSKVEANGLSKEINAILNQATIDELKYLGMPIYTGENPPNLEVSISGYIKRNTGQYLSKTTFSDFSFVVSPLLLTGSSVTTDKIGTRFADFGVRFYNQNNDNLTIIVDYYCGNESGIGIVSHMAGDGTNFTVVAKTATEISTCTSDVAWTFSSKIIDGVIQDVTIANTMLDDRGDACDVFMGNGKNRVFSQGITNYSAPTVSTNQVTSITATSATCGGEVTSEGGASVTDRGVCWSTSPTPTINNDVRSVGMGTGTFSSNITNLLPNTTYNVRAYATNSYGTAYGSNLSFTTQSAINLSLDGVWDRGDIEITFLGSEGRLTEINSGSWLDAKTKGFILLNSLKFKNIVKIGTYTWSADELWLTTTNGVITGTTWNPATLTMSTDGMYIGSYIRK